MKFGHHKIDDLVQADSSLFIILMKTSNLTLTLKSDGMNLALKNVFLLLLLLLASTVRAENPISIYGYYKNFSVAIVPPDIKELSSLYANDSPLGLVNNRLRLNLSARLSQFFSCTLAYDLSTRIQDSSFFEQQLFITEINPYQYRVTDINSLVYPSNTEKIKSFGLFQNLDRFFLTIKTGWADLDIGRQAIAWGSARVMNPTDVVAPFTFEELDTEDRIGVDAARLRIPMGFMGEFDTGIIFGKDFKLNKSAWYLRNKFYIAKTDISLLLVDFQENLLAGIDLARSIGGAGGWCEAACVIANGFQRLRNDQPTNYVRATIGADYNFSGKTYGFIEYHFSSAGAAKPELYLDIFNNSTISHGGIYLMGRHYLIPGVTYQITPLIIVTGQALINLWDKSLFAAPQIEYNISENIYLSVGFFLSHGSQPELRIDSDLVPALALQSEFGSYPDIFYTSFRIYF